MLSAHLHLPTRIYIQHNHFYGKLSANKTGSQLNFSDLSIYILIHIHMYIYFYVQANAEFNRELCNERRALKLELYFKKLAMIRYRYIYKANIWYHRCSYDIGKIEQVDVSMIHLMLVIEMYLEYIWCVWYRSIYNRSIYNR